MQVRQQTLGGAFAAAIMGGVACGLAAWMGFLGLSALMAGTLVVWLARRVVDVVPSPSRQRLGPTSWSPYDRRRSGRPRFGLSAWRRLRARRRRTGPAADGQPPVRSGILPPHWSRERDTR